MSATAFQRMRREQATKKPVDIENQSGVSALTNKELKALLDEKGIEYDAKANKATLIGLVEESQKAKEPEDGNEPEADPDNDGNKGAE